MALTGDEPVQAKLAPEVLQGTRQPPQSRQAQGALPKQAASTQISRKAAVPRPSEVLISRTSLFYCSSFPSRPGLPTSREMNPLAALCHPHTIERLCMSRRCTQQDGSRPGQPSCTGCTVDPCPCAKTGCDVPHVPRPCSHEACCLQMC